jgi:hypothetical protein
MPDTAAQIRQDGTPKQAGFFGQLSRGDGSNKVSTELSVDADGMFFPLLVPTLSKPELDFLLNNPPDPKRIPEPILMKAMEHAYQREQMGKSPFWQPGEEQFTPPEMPQ